MKTRDIVTGILILVLFFSGLSYFKKVKTKTQVDTDPTPSIEERVTTKFGGIKIPVDTHKAELIPVGKGLGIAIATKTYEGGKFKVTLLADVEAPPEGYFYQGWLTKDGTSFVSLGKLRVGKGGYMADFESVLDHSDLRKVIVTLEKTSDQKPEEHVLEGSF